MYRSIHSWGTPEGCLFAGDPQHQRTDNFLLVLEGRDIDGREETLVLLPKDTCIIEGFINTHGVPTVCGAKDFTLAVSFNRISVLKAVYLDSSYNSKTLDAC